MKEPKGRGLCPFCGSSNIYYNRRFESWRCGKCEKSFPIPSYGPGRDFGKEVRLRSPALESSLKHGRYMTPEETTKAAHLAATKQAHKYKKYKTRRFSFRTLGRALGTFWRSFRKVLILLAVLATTTVIITAVCLAISGNIKLTTGIILSLIGIGILVWGLNSLPKYRLTFTRTFMVLLISGLFIISSCVYLDIKSPTDVKESVMSAFSTEEGQFRTTVDAFVERTELKVADIGSTVEEETKDTGSTIEEATKELGDTSYVYINGGILVGADWQPIILHNNLDAKNPSWVELEAFLAEDETDKHPYDLSAFVCADFAEMLHNNAEAAGIKAAYVTVQLGPCSYFPMGGGHCLNAFETTDRGLVYVDCTSSNQAVNADKVVEVDVGKEFIPRSIFPEPGWSTIWESMGVVEGIEVIQW